MKAEDFLLETSTNDFVKKFTPWVAEKLGIESLPKIMLLDEPNELSFGAYNNQEKTIYLVTANRHPMDVLRTLAHELTHYKQDTEGRLQPTDGKTGSNEENEANAEAGIIMRNFADKHPEVFGLSESKDSKIVNELDVVLSSLCEMVLAGKQNKQLNLGMVAACVIDNDGNRVVGINSPAEDGRRRHAERVALERYKSQYNKLPRGGILVTTLSPCNQPMDERYGESCQDLVDQCGFAQVYCGYKDPTQAQDSSIETHNKRIKSLCKKFADSFLKKTTR